MNDSGEILRAALQEATSVLQSLRQHEHQITRAAALIAKCLAGGNKLLACGNGGSAADAADFTTEFACRFMEDRQPYPAVNLSEGGSLITAVANDYGFDQVFARQVRAFGRSGDVLIAISTSGNSKNVCRALEEAKSCGVVSIALLGRDGAACHGIAEVEIIVPGTSTARIQEAHRFLLHVLCEIVEDLLHPL